MATHDYFQVKARTEETRKKLMDQAMPYGLVIIPYGLGNLYLVAFDEATLTVSNAATATADLTKEFWASIATLDEGSFFSTDNEQTKMFLIGAQLFFDHTTTNPSTEKDDVYIDIKMGYTRGSSAPVHEQKPVGKTLFELESGEVTGEDGGITEYAGPFLMRMLPAVVNKRGDSTVKLFGQATVWNHDRTALGETTTYTIKIAGYFICMDEAAFKSAVQLDAMYKQLTSEG